MLGAIVLRYVQDVPGPQVAGLRQLLLECTRQPLELSSTSVTVLQELCQETIGRCWDAVTTSRCCAALVVLWLALAPEKFPLLADTFISAAGTAGKQKWSLILPSSARVSELTYVTIVGTRYPELDTYQNDTIPSRLWAFSSACVERLRLHHSCAVPLAFACAPHTKPQDLCEEPVQWLRTHQGSHTAVPHH